MLTSSVLEARLEQASLLKKVPSIGSVHAFVELNARQVVDAIKDLVQDCNFDCNDSGIALQAMDNSHVALVSMMLKAEGFSPFRCDRNIALGINLNSDPPGALTHARRREKCVDATDDERVVAT